MPAEYPVTKVTLPATLKGVSNGKVPGHLLRRIAPRGVVHVTAARAWDAMRAHALRDGIDLGVVGSYRTFADQLAMFRQRYTRKVTSSPAKTRRIYDGDVYNLIPGKSPVASPGKSNHGFGIAIDACVRVKRAGGFVNKHISTDPDGRGPATTGLNWLLKHAGTYGFSWEVASGPNAEAWHIRYHAGNKIPLAVLAYEAARSK